MKQGRPPYSYEPLRRSILDILNVEPGPLGAAPRTSWSTIYRDLVRRADHPKELAANVGVAKALHDMAEADGITGRRHEFFPLAIGISHKISFWSPAVVALSGRATVPFIDPRRDAKKLTADARRFVFSVMHERIRVADPDFAEVGLAIIQFATEDNNVRVPRLHLVEDVSLFDFDTLDSMVRETYELWAEVLDGREEEARRSTGTYGPLFDR